MWLVKSYQTFCAIKKNVFCECIYKMYLISAKWHENTGVEPLWIKKTGAIWPKMKDVQDGLGVQNISDLVLKEIYGICKTKSFTKEQIKKNKMTGR